jgi:hypothetical protein
MIHTLAPVNFITISTMEDIDTVRNTYHCQHLVVIMGAPANFSGLARKKRPLRLARHPQLGYWPAPSGSQHDKLGEIP